MIPADVMALADPAVVNRVSTAILIGESSTDKMAVADILPISNFTATA
jgi:hypothetical protein